MQIADIKIITEDQGPYNFEPDRNVSLWVRRLDLIDPVLGGNKLFKLKVHLIKARELGIYKLITFGGAFSNHIAATARAGALFGFQTAAIIRGESEYAANKTLSRAKADGMRLHFVSRSVYQERTRSQFPPVLPPGFEDWYLIPEGGSGPDGVEGCKEILQTSDEKYDVIAVSCGTGATAAGLISTLHPHQELLGISVLKDGGELEKSISSWIPGSSTTKPRWQINRDFVFGGYGKSSVELDRFIGTYAETTGIPTEKVYTAKMFFGLYKLIREGYFIPGTKILAIHTGGLQYLKTD